MTVLNEGRPVFVDGDDDRIGRGPWARWLATSVVPDEGSPRAERGRILARTGHVHSVSVVEGAITAQVIGSGGDEYRVGLAADPVSPRVWAAVIGSPRGRTLFEAAAAGRDQSLQLEHVMTVDWDEPLIPPARSVRLSCTCPDADYSGACKHVIALAYVVADAIDADPSLLLEWRGCTAEATGGAGAGRGSSLGRSVGRRRRCPSSARRARCPSAPCSSGSARAGSSSTASICATRSSPPTPRSPARPLDGTPTNGEGRRSAPRRSPAAVDPCLALREGERSRGRARTTSRRRRAAPGRRAEAHPGATVTAVTAGAAVMARAAGTEAGERRSGDLRLHARWPATR